MQYAVSTPDEYLSALDHDWRRHTLMSIRELIRRGAPELNESIKYGMLSYDDDRGGVFGLNAQKGYVSFYVGSAEKVDPTGDLLGKLPRGKGCVRFGKSARVEETRIDEFISRAAAARREGGDIDC